MKKIYTFIFVIGFVIIAKAQSTYKLDSTFGSTGIATSSATNNFLAYARGGVLNNDGTVWLAGQIRGAGNSSSAHFIARKLANGNPDLGFCTTGAYAYSYTSWTTMGELFEIFALKNNSAYAPHTGYGGHYAPSSTASQTYEEVWQPYNPNVSKSSCKLNDSVVISLTSVGLCANKGNSMSSFMGFNWFNGNYEGFVPTTVNGFTINDNQLVISQSNEKILVAGMYMNGSSPVLFIERFKKKSYNELDSTFGVNGVSTAITSVLNTLNATTITDLYVQNDNKIIAVVGKYFVRLNADGSVDNTFGSSGYFAAVLNSFSGIIKKTVTNSANTELYCIATDGTGDDYVAAFYADGNAIYSFHKGSHLYLKNASEINYSSLTLNDISINSLNDILVCGGALKTATSTPEVFALKLKKGVCATINIATQAINDTTYKVTLTGTTALPFQIWYLPETAATTITSGNTIDIDVEVGKSYTITVADANGCSNTIQLDVNAASVENLNKNFASTIAPNPASKSIAFTASDVNQNAMVSVYSVEGKLLFSQKIKSGKNEIELAHLEKGIYLLQLTNGNQNGIAKFVKE